MGGGGGWKGEGGIGGGGGSETLDSAVKIKMINPPSISSNFDLL